MKTTHWLTTIILIPFLSISCLSGNRKKANRTENKNQAITENMTNHTETGIDTTLTGLDKYSNIRQFEEYVDVIRKETLKEFNNEYSYDYEDAYGILGGFPYVDSGYMELIAPYIMRGLEQKGFRPVPEQVFKTRLREVFGIDVDRPNLWMLYYKNGFEFFNGLYYLFRENDEDFFKKFTTRKQGTELQMHYCPCTISLYISHAPIRPNYSNYRN